MKTLADIKNFLATFSYKQIMVTAVLDDKSQIKLWIGNSYGQNNPNPLEVNFRGEDGSHVDEMDWEFLKHCLGNYASWAIDPRDVAIWNFYKNIKEWVEVSKEYYWDALEAVPPAYHRNMVFACGEAYTHNDDGEPVYSFFKADNGKYWVQLMSKREYLASK
jgi:hypothetical protein